MPVSELAGDGGAAPGCDGVEPQARVGHEPEHVVGHAAAPRDVELLEGVVASGREGPEGLGPHRGDAGDGQGDQAAVGSDERDTVVRHPVAPLEVGLPQLRAALRELLQ